MFDVFQNLIFTMSLSGSAVFVIYILTYPIAKRFFPMAWRYFILKMVLFFFLFPLPELKYVILGALSKTFPQLHEKLFTTSLSNDNTYMVIINDSWIQLTPRVLHILKFMTFGGIIAIICVIMIIAKYQKVKKICILNADDPVPGEWKEKFLKVKRELRVEKDVRLVCSRYCNTPMEMRIFSPIIIFPIKNPEIDSLSYELMMRHELAHIKHRDLIIKFLGILSVILHCYNPFSYVFFYELCFVSEIFSDE